MCHTFCSKTMGVYGVLTMCACARICVWTECVQLYGGENMHQYWHTLFCGNIYIYRLHDLKLMRNELCNKDLVQFPFRKPSTWAPDKSRK